LKNLKTGDKLYCWRTAQFESAFEERSATIREGECYTVRVEDLDTAFITCDNGDVIVFTNGNLHLFFCDIKKFRKIKLQKLENAINPPPPVIQPNFSFSKIGKY